MNNELNCKLSLHVKSRKIRTNKAPNNIGQKQKPNGYPQRRTSICSEPNLEYKPKNIFYNYRMDQSARPHFAIKLGVHYADEGDISAEPAKCCPFLFPFLSSAISFSSSGTKWCTSSETGLDGYSDTCTKCRVINSYS